MTFLSLLHAILGLFTQAGAHHTLHGHQYGEGYVASKRFLVVVCKVPAHLHGTFHCSGWVKH